MTRRIREHEPASLIDMKQSCPERQDLVSGLAKVGDVDVKMELLRTIGARPTGRRKILDELKCVDRPIIDVQGRKCRARRPSRIGPVHLAAK